MKKRALSLYMMHVSVHGLIRADEPEIGVDADTGGQVSYVLDLARALGRHPRIRRVDLITRLIPNGGYDREREPLGGRATLWRIPCGPAKYLRKELLWPYLPEMVDQIIRFIRKQNDIPDIIHAHYADAGLVATRIAKVLGIPLIFTAHSLGRYKQKRLLTGGMSRAQAERAYHFQERIEAEEETLENASLVIASSNDEVERQYRLYDRYNRYAMRVLAPGCDIERFATPSRGGNAALMEKITPFLRDPRKPALTVIARPDPQKNIPAAIHLFANSGLAQIANLTLFVGQRDVIAEFGDDRRQLFTDLLRLIDRHDLYGHVAYPKTHDAETIVAAYAHAKKTGGALLCLSHHENFGLTLVEAAAAGVPVVSSGIGGMKDVLEVCQHGIAVDPDDPQSASEVRALLEDKAKWRQFSANGRRAARRHYSWRAHVETYLDHIGKVQAFRSPQILKSHRPRRFASARIMLVCDLDGTLTGSASAIARLNRLIDRHGDVLFGVATGRNLESALDVLRRWRIVEPQFLIASVGTAIHYNVGRYWDDRYWPQHIRFRWRPERVAQLMEAWPGLKPQEPDAQTPFKISYYRIGDEPVDTRAIKRNFRRNGVHARVILTERRCLDILPVRASKGHALRYLCWRLGFDAANVVTAGDANNDLDMLRGCTMGIVVANHSLDPAELEGQADVFFANRPHAAGIVEGLAHYGLLQ
jgi:sucrose-phosphate synthase